MDNNDTDTTTQSETVTASVAGETVSQPTQSVTAPKRGRPRLTASGRTPRKAPRAKNAAKFKAAPPPQPNTLNRALNFLVVVAVFITALLVQRIVPTEQVATPKVVPIPAPVAAAAPAPAVEPASATPSPAPTDAAAAPAAATTPTPAPVAAAAQPTTSPAPEQTAAQPAASVPAAPAPMTAAATPAPTAPAPAPATTSAPAPAAASAPAAEAPAPAVAATAPAAPLPAAADCIPPAPATPAKKATVASRNKAKRQATPSDTKTPLNAGGTQDLDGEAARKAYQAATRSMAPAPANR